MISLLVVLTITNAVSATDYYVATIGSDSDTGSQSQPFQTIARALAAARLPGDNVIVREGIYPQSRTLNLVNAGAKGQFITLRAFKDENVVIDGSNTPPGASLIAVLSHHIRIQGLTIQNSNASGITAWGPGSRVHDIQVIGNSIHNCQLSGFYAGFNQLSNPVRDILVEGNTIKDCVQSNNKTTHTSWSFGLGAGLSKNVTIRKNIVSRCYGEGIGLYLSDHGVIEDNTVHDNFSVNLYLDNTTNTRVNRNLVYSTHDKKFYRFNHPASGIQIANENYPGRSNPSSHNVITNNILINNYVAFYYGSYQRGGGLRQTLFANNTAYGSTGPLLSINADKGHQDSRIINNIFHQVEGAKITDVQGSTDQIKFRNNLWYGGAPHQAVKGTSDIYTDPLFINGGSNKAKGCKLRKNSPARNAGIKAKEVDQDFGGNQRHNKIDLGAWQSEDEP
ncbi:right-handed parallel beta-helix repeat-containing protein [uncultured Gimesia sp.]|uniref:right-handed parallel beta-helix repeat-containing protein n=1 Tax=uncultured Gimesia sp. TaxID=1678688 RepID=UPI00261AD9EF|nr:right-handed parallel beta-helix repeat-containing protein [uncultured Gimesia sp.]